MTDPNPQSTLREWRNFISKPQTLVSLAAVCAVLTIVGPFETDTRLSLPERAVYWSVLVLASFGAGALINIAVARRTEGAPFAARLLLTGLGCAAAVIALVLLLNYIAFGWWPSGSDWVTFGGSTIGISFIVNTALAILMTNRPAESAPDEAHDAPAILDRLPLPLRAPLVALSVEDHYVRIRTTAGEDLVLLRLSDAIREVGATDGAQVHRSHWVAWAHVRNVVRRGDGALLEMAHGPDIPVSRSKMSLLKEAGLVPK